MVAQMPHCDQYVLHAPGECEYCDHYPEAQAQRVKDGINFTGKKDPSKKQCPAEARRALANINRWPGNIPHAPTDPDCQCGASMIGVLPRTPGHSDWCPARSK